MIAWICGWLIDVAEHFMQIFIYFA